MHGDRRSQAVLPVELLDAKNGDMNKELQEEI
jgi:hypothetical protein